MKYVYLTIALILLVFGSYPGMLWQRHVDEKEAISENVAHYNPKTAEFAWGSAESTNLVALNLGEIMGQLPERKPKVK